MDVLSPEGGEIFGLRTAAGDTLTSRNVIGFIQGSDPRLRDRYVVIGARLDNLGSTAMTIDGQPARSVYPGANGNASGLAILLELASRISSQRLLFNESILLVAFGASCESFAGAWYFINRSFAGDRLRMDAMINLDMLGRGEDFYAFTASNEDLNNLLVSTSAQLQPVQPRMVSNQPYPSDHLAFYEREIPSVFFTTGRYPEHNTVRDRADILDYELMERETEYIGNFVRNHCLREETIRFRNTPAPQKVTEDGDVYAWYECDVPPAFLGSADPSKFMKEWVHRYLKYPEDAVREGVRGTVNVNFIIEKDGTVSHVRVVRGVDPRLDEAAVKVVSVSPKWRPARLRGEKVRSTMTVPVEFRLRKNK